MRSLATGWRRFGARRLHWLLAREGVRINHKKFQRLYSRKSACRYDAAVAANGLWAHGRPWPFRKAATGYERWTSCPMRSPEGVDFRSLSFSTTSPASVSVQRRHLDFRLRVARELDWAIPEWSRQEQVASNNGIQMISMAIMRWSKEREVE